MGLEVGVDGEVGVDPVAEGDLLLVADGVEDVLVGGLRHPPHHLHILERLHRLLELVPKVLLFPQLLVQLQST